MDKFIQTILDGLTAMLDPQYQEALKLALKKIGTKDRFESEVHAFLADFPSDTSERVIEFLKERRIINDTRTIQNLLERYSGKRSIGIEKLRAELLERGAPEETIEAVLIQHAHGESQRLSDVLSAKFKPSDSRAKAGRFLFSRGFSEDAIESALDRFFGN